MKPHNKIQKRMRHSLPSFTLVELLIAISIIGIMVGMVLYTLAGARRDSLTARTQGTLKKINDIMLTRWEEFRYRAVNINIEQEWLMPISLGANNGATAPLSPREGARLRMIVLRDLMRMEFPDRYSDLTVGPAYYKTALYTSDNSINDIPLVVDRTVPSIYNTFRKKIGLGAVGNPILSTTAIVNSAMPASPSLQFEQAELLYQIVASSNFNGANGLEFFRPSEIGDVDGDNYPEFIDAWGTPIMWIRWPAGYGVIDPNSVTPPLNNEQAFNSVPTDATMNDRTVPDPMDPLRTDWRWTHPAFTTVSKPWMLVPLIVSAGPDGMFDLKFDYDSSSGGRVAYGNQTWLLGGTGSTAHNAPPYPYSYPDPYYKYYDTTQSPVIEAKGGLGEWQDDDKDHNTFGAQDNITNYSLLLE